MNAVAENKSTRLFNNEELRRIVGSLKQAPKQMVGLWLTLFYAGNLLRETLKMQRSWIDWERNYLLRYVDLIIVNLAESSLISPLAASKAQPLSRAAND